MRPFEDFVNIIIEHEGGYVNDKDDKGGATKYGISLRFLKSIEVCDGDIDDDGDVDIDDIKKLTISESKELYKKYFFDKMLLSQIKDDLASLHIFDHGVNAGTGTAVKLAQRIVKCKEDGIMGKKTITAINEYKNSFVLEYKNLREIYYATIVAKNPINKKFFNGWINRVRTTNF